MSWGTRPRTFLAFVGVAAIVSGALGTRQQSVSAAPVPTGRQDFGALAPAFVLNAGEADRAARFVSVGGGRPVFFTADGVRIVDPRDQRSLWLTFADADALRIEGDSPTGGRVTFLRGRKNLSASGDPDGSRLAYRDVVYRRLWPGIDARITGAGNGLKYAFEIAPQSDPRAIHLRYEGADRIAVTDGGELTIEVGDSTDHRRRANRISARRRAHGPGRRALLPARRRGWLLARPLRSRAAARHRSHSSYSTFLGSSGYDAGRAIAVDPTGAAYVVGTTRGLDFPTTPGSYQPTFRGGSGNLASDAFVAKLNAAGRRSNT